LKSAADITGFATTAFFKVRRPALVLVFNPSGIKFALIPPNRQFKNGPDIQMHHLLDTQGDAVKTLD
jgi:hypothetical protein